MQTAASPDHRPPPPLLFPLRLVLRPSRRLLILLCALHAVVLYAFCQLAAQLSWWLLPVVLVLLYSLYRKLRHEAQRRGVELICHASGEFSVPACGIGHEQAVFIERSTDFGWAIWLHWKNPRPQRRAASAMMLCADHFHDRQAWRHFRIWVRHKATQAAEDKVF